MFFFRKLDQKLRDLNHRRIDAFRKWRLIFFLSLFNQKNNSAQVGTGKRCLILRLDGKLGDTVISTGLFRALADEGYEIDIVTRPQNTFVYEFVPVKHRLLSLKKGLFSSLRLFLLLRKENYDALVCSTHILDPTSLWLSRFVRAHKKTVFLNEQINFFDQHIQRNFLTAHITERHQQVFQSITGKKSPTVCQYFLKISDKTFQEAADFIKNYKKVIILNSFTGAKLRNFSMLTTQSLIEKLTQDCVVISIGNEGDLNILREWNRSYQNPNWVIPSRGDFAFNAALIKLSNVVITPDTSIVHIASAFNAPLVAIYRKDTGEELNSKIWAPKTNGAKIIYAPLIDINSVDVDQIVNAAKDLLARSP